MFEDYFVSVRDAITALQNNDKIALKHYEDLTFNEDIYQDALNSEYDALHNATADVDIIDREAEVKRRVVAAFSNMGRQLDPFLIELLDGYIKDSTEPGDLVFRLLAAERERNAQQARDEAAGQAQEQPTQEQQPQRKSSKRSSKKAQNLATPTEGSLED